METIYIFLGAVVLAAILAILLLAKNKGASKPMTRKELGSAEDILNEVEIYVSYELKSKAIKLLKAGRKAYPGNQRIQRKLSELAK